MFPTSVPTAYVCAIVGADQPYMNDFGAPVHGRVNQLDASLLDSQLLEQLKEKLKDAFKFWQGDFKDKYDSELGLLLRALLFKITVWDHGTTYGAKLQNLVLVSKKTGLPIGPKLRALYGLITVLGPYVVSKLEERQFLSPQTVDKITLAVNSASLFNFVAFLYSGEYLTMVLRLLGARWASVTRSTNRLVNYEFQNRQLVWNALTEFLYFVIPLINIKKLVRRVLRPQTKTSAKSLQFLSKRLCAICFEQDSTIAAKGITNPYTAGCPHTYCYVCLSLRLAEDPEFRCLRCGEPNSKSLLKPFGTK